MVLNYRNKFEKNITEIKKHLYRLEKAYKFLNEKDFHVPLTPNDIEKILKNDNLVLIFDQIVYRFSKLQDTLGKVFKLFLIIKGENVENLPIIDIINLLEKFGFNISKDKWFELRELRNIITHEYEDEYEKICEVINKIFYEKDYINGLVKKLIVD